MKTSCESQHDAKKSEATLKRPGYRWRTMEMEAAIAAKLAAEARIPPVLAEILSSRGVRTAEEAHRFLHPGIDDLHEPMRMLGMELAVKRVERAIAAGERILLYGDYDVDGTVAVVLLKTAIEMVAARGDETAKKTEVRFHVPHRLREGYGLQTAVLEEAAREGVTLVITVDTGMRAFAETRAARALGMDVIVTDHHLPEAGDALPEALAVLNPNQPGCGYPEKGLCGAAIALKLAQALLERQSTDEQGRERVRSRTLPSMLKMAAIATVADAVPLVGENRVMAAVGMEELRRPSSVGLQALMQTAGIDVTGRAVTSFDLGFRLGPRINAAGRMDVAGDVVELFTTRDRMRALELAAKLEEQNKERRATEAEALKVIEDWLETDEALQTKAMLVLAGEGWHRGVIGILASRVVERTAKPVIVVSVEDGVAYGSGRSIDGFPLLEAIEPCAELFTRFGGHAFAVGFAMPAGNLAEMERRVQAFADERLAGRVAEHTLRIDAELPLERLTSTVAGWLRKLEPTGRGNPAPVLLARRVRVVAPVRVMKDVHIRLEVMPDETRVRMEPLKAVGWKLAEQAAELGLEAGSVIDLAYRVRENERRQAGDAEEMGGMELEIAGMRLNE